MSIITKMLKQDAIYWGPPVPDGDGGSSYPDPVEISCRWEDVDGAVVDPRTHDTFSNATVYVDRDVEINGYLFLGALSEVSGENPEDVIGARKIAGFQKLPTFKATEFLRTVTV